MTEWGTHMRDGMSTSAPAPGRGLALACLILGISMAMLDVTIVNVALPTLEHSLDVNEATLSWVVSGYSLAGGIILITAGRLGDRIGHKPIFVTGLALFTIASAWCGFAADGTQLVIARVIQGLGFGIFFPAVAAFIQLMYSGRERGRAFAVMGAVIGLFTAAGPLVGGLLIEAFGELDGWRWIFWVNLPFGALALIGALILLPRGRAGERRERLDPVGLILVTLALVAILVPLIEGQELGWPWWLWAVMVAGAAILVAFWFVQVARARQGRAQLVPPRLFSHRAFTTGVIFGFVYFAAFTSVSFALSIYWQAGLGHTALETGLMSLPFSFGVIIGASFCNQLAHALGRGVLAIGTALLSIGFLSLWASIAFVPPAEISWLTLLGPLAVSGLGSGFVTAPNTTFIVATVDPAEAGAASGVLSTIQRVGVAAGIAVVGAVMFGLLGQRLGAEATAMREPDQLADAVSHAFQVGAAGGILVSALCAVASFALVWTLPRRVEERGPTAPSAR